MRYRRQTAWAAVAIVAAAYAAFVIAWRRTEAAPPGRGINFSHDIHAVEHEIACSDCHGFDDTKRLYPGHEICGVCHETDRVDADETGCRMCHTNDSYTLTEFRAGISDEVRFSHPVHIDAGVDCVVCHEKPDRAPLPAAALMEFCMDCHAQVNPALNECAACHTEITQASLPQFRNNSRIVHDNLAAWEHVHGHEFAADPRFCAYCHDDGGEMCETCHRQQPPQNHTAVWRRRTHGMFANFDRMNCAVCHEEDSCLKCHQNTQPASHRRPGWDEPFNRHCVSCHYPPENNNCTVCHERIDHRSAIASPHNIGIFPPNCSVCHPGGNPYRAPHPLNSTAACVVCHD